MRWLTPHDAKPLLTDGGEIAFLDVRESGQYAAGHPFFAVPLPYSRLEIEAPALLPRRSVCIVLIDDGDGVAEKAGRRLASLGFTDLAAVEGGAPGWARAGYTLYEGVNVPSKTFGELVEHACGMPSISARELKARRDAGETLVLLDGRPLDEHRRMTIPGSTCCPNAELGHRLPLLVPDEATPVVVSCAGRTRSIIGAQSLRELGISNPVLALENGTQGWQLAGLALEHGADRGYPDRLGDDVLARSRERAAAFRRRRSIPLVDAATLEAWRGDGTRTLYLFDVRTPEEYRRNRYPGAVHAPGGQLVQATDRWVAVRGARIVLSDDTGLRAAVTAYWLRCMGHDARVLDHDATRPVAEQSIEEIGLVDDLLPRIGAGELRSLLEAGAVTLLDVGSSAEFRRGHAAGARWAIRPRLERLGLAPGSRIVVAARDWPLAELAAIDLAEAGLGPIQALAGGPDDWRAAGLDIVATPDDPPDADRIDFVHFVHDRHAGNLEACRAYLAWETNLVNQLDEQERGVFRPAG